MRNFYKDPALYPATGSVYEYDDDQVSQGFVREGLIAMTEEEADTYINPPPTEAEVLASQSLKLQGFTQLAAAQKASLTNRIGTINDAIEFEEATSAELAELPLRQAQLTKWKRYAVDLGRVTTQPGWYSSVVWPTQPTEGMDLTVSATAPEII